MQEIVLHGRRTLVHVVKQMEHTVKICTGPGVSVKTFVIFDTETTGLPSPGYNPCITELCFIAVTREELLTKQKAPRVLNKLVMCFNPSKKIGFSASQITDLHNDALEDMASFTKQAPLIGMFLQNLPQPVCLIAHNGNSFDFPLLVSQLSIGGEIPEYILCSDSMEALRTFDGLPPVPEYLLQKRKVNNSSAASLTANTQGVKLFKEVTETSGNVLKLKKTNSIESRDITNNMTTDQSQNDSSDNLKRTADTVETSYINSKQAKVSSTHAVVWDKVEQTPHVVKKAASFGPGAIIYSGKGLPKGNGDDVKRHLFHEDSGSGSPVIDSNSVNYNTDIISSTSSLAESHDNIGRLESAVKFVGEKAANSPVVTQSHNYGLGKIPVDALTSARLEERSVKKRENTQKVENLSYSLVNVYARMFGQKPPALHTAEGDCLALLEILHSKMAEFSSWCDTFAVPLTNISPMY